MVNALVNFNQHFGFKEIFDYTNPW